MASFSITIAFSVLFLLLIKYYVLDPLVLSPLSRVPGPTTFALTKWRLGYEDWRGTRTPTIQQLHSKYGPAVRIGPNEVSFNSLTALKTVYGPGSRYGRTAFYRMFDVYGEQNLFSFHSVEEHGSRKKLLSHAYAKSTVLKTPTTQLIEEKTREYMDLIGSEPNHISDVFHTLHYYSLDNITSFIYGKHGSTSALRGSGTDRALISDIMHPSRRKLSWCLAASECADHFLAGIDTTSDTLMFLIWSLSLPENQRFQDKLRDELLGLPAESLNEHGYPRAEESDRCTYLHAIIKETLRLYAPLPSSEPRSVNAASMVDGYRIPADTVVSISPWILHRNPEVFKNPLEFNPERWLGPDATELNRWFWAFSSGGRMCIGMHLAMAEMTTLIAALYREYQTSIAPGFEDTTPGITARVEVFYDERFPTLQENTCLIKFDRLRK
ncbi:hypothetical protein LRP88_01857 [Fusarium phalaenopsidis]